MNEQLSEEIGEWLEMKLNEIGIDLKSVLDFQDCSDYYNLQIEISINKEEVESE